MKDPLGLLVDTEIPTSDPLGLLEDTTPQTQQLPQTQQVATEATISAETGVDMGEPPPGQKPPLSATQTPQSEGYLKRVGRRLVSIPETIGQLVRVAVEAPVQVGMEFGGTAGLMAEGLDFKSAREEAAKAYREIGTPAFDALFGTGKLSPQTEKNMEFVGSLLGLPAHIADWTDAQTGKVVPKYKEMVESVPASDWGKLAQAVLQEGRNWASAIGMFKSGTVGKAVGKKIAERAGRETPATKARAAELRAQEKAVDRAVFEESAKAADTFTTWEDYWAEVDRLVKVAKQRQAAKQAAEGGPPPTFQEWYAEQKGREFGDRRREGEFGVEQTAEDVAKYGYIWQREQRDQSVRLGEELAERTSRQEQPLRQPVTVRGAMQERRGTVEETPYQTTVTRRADRPVSAEKPNNIEVPVTQEPSLPITEPGVGAVPAAPGTLQGDVGGTPPPPTPSTTPTDAAAAATASVKPKRRVKGKSDADRVSDTVRRKEAGTIGVRYDGVREVGAEKLYQYTDFDTGSTFYVREGDKVGAKLEEIRKPFYEERRRGAEPDTVLPALKDPSTGRVYSGKSHMEAIDAAGGDPTGMIEGWISPEGRWWTDAQALEWDKARQVKGTAKAAAAKAAAKVEPPPKAAQQKPAGMLAIELLDGTKLVKAGAKEYGDIADAYGIPDAQVKRGGTFDGKTYTWTHGDVGVPEVRTTIEQRVAGAQKAAAIAAKIEKSGGTGDIQLRAGDRVTKADVAALTARGLEIGTNEKGQTVIKKGLKAISDDIKKRMKSQRGSWAIFGKPIGGGAVKGVEAGSNAWSSLRNRKIRREIDDSSAKVVLEDSIRKGNVVIGEGDVPAYRWLNGVITSPESLSIVDKDIAYNPVSSSVKMLEEQARKYKVPLATYLERMGFSKEDIKVAVTETDTTKRLVDVDKAVDTAIEEVKNAKSATHQKLAGSKLLRTMEKRFIASAGRAISRETDSGKKLVDTVYDGFDSGERAGGEYEANYRRDVEKVLTENEKAEFRWALDTGNEPKSAKVKEAVEMEKARFATVAKMIEDFNAEAIAKGEPPLTTLRRGPSKWKIEGRQGEWTLIDENGAVLHTASRKSDLEQIRRDFSSPEFQKRTDFYPRRIKPEIVEGRIEEVIDHLLKTGQVEAVNTSGMPIPKEVQRAVARAKINIYKRRNSERRSGSIGHSRELNLPEWAYENNVDIEVPLYYADTLMRIEQAKRWGAKDQVLRKYVEKIAEEGGDSEFATRVLDRVLHKEPMDTTMAKTVQAITGYQIVTKMGWSALSQMTQRVSALVRNGAKATVKAQRKMITDYDTMLDLFIRSGSGLRGVAQHARMALAGSRSASAETFLYWTQFSKHDLRSRMLANLSGRFAAEFAIDKLRKKPQSQFARRRLQQYDIDPEAIIKQGYKATEAQLLRAAQKAEIDSNFRNRVMDIPEFASSYWGRVVTQFSTFAYSQTKFLRDYVIKEARHANILPLVYLLTVGEVSGEVVNQIRSWITGHERPANIPRRLLENLATVGTLGIFEKAFSTVRYGDAPIGPTLSTAKKAGEAGLSALRGNVKPGVEFLLGEIPFAGGRLKKEFKERTQPQSLKSRKRNERRYWEHHPWDVRGIYPGTPPRKNKGQTVRDVVRQVMGD